jgi:hypothetical protein
VPIAGVTDDFPHKEQGSSLWPPANAFAPHAPQRGPIPGGPLVYVAGTFSKWTSLTQVFLILHGGSQHYFSSNSRQKSGWLGTSF